MLTRDFRKYLGARASKKSEILAELGIT